MRLIDANTLFKRAVKLEAVALEQARKYEPLDNPREWRIWSAILTERTAFKFDLMDAPIIEAELVVRCKDCKWRGTRGCAVMIVDESDKPKDDDFCSWGERREDETN